MIIFIENAASLVVQNRTQELCAELNVLIITNGLKKYDLSDLHKSYRVWYASALVIRWLKVLFGIFQLPIVQSDPLGLAYRINFWKLIISDGLLTEFLVSTSVKIPKKFYSIVATHNAYSESREEVAIVGSNWLEFGSMKEAAYHRHLTFLKSKYPHARYYCHPRESTSLPDQVFGVEMVKREKKPLELYFMEVGFPSRLVGVCSTSLLTLPCLAPQSVSVDMVVLAPDTFDGPKADLVLATKLLNGKKYEISVAHLQRFISSQLRLSAINVETIVQPRA